MSTSKTKLTLSIDKDVLESARKVAIHRHIPLSRLVENFLNFFARPELYCFKCGEKFNTEDADVCTKCGWLSCPKCEVCRCDLSDDVAIAIYQMRKVYEDLLGGRVK
ncbi:MAG: DUF6364 family protein [Candidatus Methylarchaceae archaeon HK02M2]|nr:DUF6364 family protein [Candidatus Methylarchaceae archaeon HK02M2]